MDYDKLEANEFESNEQLIEVIAELINNNGQIFKPKIPEHMRGNVRLGPSGYNYYERGGDKQERATAANGIEVYNITKARLAFLKLNPDYPNEIPTDPVELLALLRQLHSEQDTKRYPKIGAGPEPTERLMTVAVACEWYKIKKKRVYRLLEAGKLTCWPDNKNLTRIDTNELKTYANLRDYADRIKK